MLDFYCDRCKKKISVDFSDKSGEDALLYSKELQAGKQQ